MKTLTPEQRIDGFTKLEGVIGEGGVGGAHLASFLAGIAHAEEVLGEEQDDEPVAWGYQEPWGEITDCISNHAANEAETYGDYKVPLYHHPAPRKFVGNKNEK